MEASILAERGAKWKWRRRTQYALGQSRDIMMALTRPFSRLIFKLQDFLHSTEAHCGDANQTFFHHKQKLTDSLSR